MKPNINQADVPVCYILIFILTTSDYYLQPFPQMSREFHTCGTFQLQQFDSAVVSIIRDISEICVKKKLDTDFTDYADVKKSERKDNLIR